MAESTGQGRSVASLISTDSGNGLVESGQDQKLFFNKDSFAVRAGDAGRAIDVRSVVPAEAISSDPSNRLELGSDGGLFVRNQREWGMDTYGRTPYFIVTPGGAASGSLNGDVYTININHRGNYDLVFSLSFGLDPNVYPDPYHPSWQVPNQYNGLRFKWDIDVTLNYGAPEDFILNMYLTHDNAPQGHFMWSLYKGEPSGMQVDYPRNQWNYISWGDLAPFVTEHIQGMDTWFILDQNRNGPIYLLAQMPAMPITGQIIINIANCRFQYANS